MEVERSLHLNGHLVEYMNVHSGSYMQEYERGVFESMWFLFFCVIFLAKGIELVIKGRPSYNIPLGQVL